MGHSEIKLEDLNDWLQKDYATFTTSKRENKSLILCFDGYMEVIVGNSIVWRGKQPDLAVEKYNSITEKWEDTLKDFKI